MGGPEEEQVEWELDEDPDGESLRWYVVAGFVAAVVAGFAVAVWCSLSWTAGCSDIDDATTSVAGDSLRAGLCRSGHGAAVALIPAGWVVGLALATLAVLRWAGGLRATVLLVLLLLAPAALPAAAFAGLSRSGTACSAEELAAYRGWVDAGSRGQPPHDCRTF